MAIEDMSASSSQPVTASVRNIVDLDLDDRITLLKGFSGCLVVLCERADGTRFVRKVAPNHSYNRRLKIQVDKQSKFVPSHQCYAVPILKSGILLTGAAYVDMDYIPGITAAEAIFRAPLSEVPNWAQLLLCFTDPRPQAAHATIKPDVFLKKIDLLEHDLISRGYATALVRVALSRLKSRSWDGIPETPCHGDLTLENIIVHNSKFYLFDFLDSFAETWYADIAKLMQDLIAGWSFRHRLIDRNLAIRLAALKDSLEYSLEKIDSGALDHIHALYVLALIRILPYANQLHERDFIDDRVASALDVIL